MNLVLIIEKIVVRTERGFQNKVKFYLRGK